MSVRTKIPGDSSQFGCEALSGRPEFPGAVFRFECEAFVCQNQNSSRRFPNLTRCVFQSQPKFLAIVSSLNATCSSVRTEFRGSSFQRNAGGFVGQDQNSSRYFPVQMRGVCRSETNSLAVFSDLNAMGFSVRTEIPGGIYQFECEAFCGQNQNPRRYFPVKMRGVCRSEPEFLAVCTRLNARRSWRFSLVFARGVCLSAPKFLAISTNLNRRRFRSEPKFLAIATSLNAGRVSVRTKIPGGIPQFKCEAFLGQNRNSAVYTSLNARRFSVRTEFPAGICLF